MSSTDELAARLSRLSRRIEEVANQPRLVAASMPKGESIDIIDPETDQPVMVIGEQHDGTVGAYPLDGPIPPVPSMPLVESGPLTLAVTYDGRMASEDDRFPMDGEHIEVWAWPAGAAPDDVDEPDTVPVPDPGDDPDDPTPPEPVPDLDDLPEPDLGEPELVGVLPAGGGTYALARPAGSWGITFRTKTLAGRRSAHSGMAFGEITGPANLTGIDEEARARNEEIAADLAQAEQALDTARSLIAALRERTGRKAWNGPTFPAPTFTVKPTGSGRLRLEATATNGVAFAWTLTGPAGRTQTHTGKTVDAVVDVAGTWTVALDTDTGPGGHVIYDLPITVTAAMLTADYGWADLTLSLDQLTAPGGPLDPQTLAEVWLPAVAGAFVVATEAFVGPAALIDGIVQARHMAAVSELPNGAKVSIVEDGIRMWQAGNTGPWPNLMLTVGDGFRLLRNDGTTVLWIDNDGNVNTAGAVLSNAKIVAPEVTGGVVTGATVRTAETGQRAQMSSGMGIEVWNAANERVLWVDPTTGKLRLSGAVQSGGEIDGAALYVRTPGGDTVFSATPTGGVVIGGGGAVYDRAGPWTTTEDSHWITDAVPVTPGSTYGWRFRLQGSPGFTSEANYVEVVFQIGTTQAGEAITTQGGLHAVGSTQGLIEGKLVAPAGASTMRLRYRRTDTPTLPEGQYVQFSQVRITAVSAGTIDVAGSVKSPRGVFDVVEAGKIRGSNGIAWDPSDTGWLTFNLSGDWTAQGFARRRKQGTRVWLRGEVMALNAAAGIGRPITTLPTGWRPFQRLRVPWGWGDSLTYVVVETDGTIWSGPNARTAAPGMSLDVISFTTD